MAAHRKTRFIDVEARGFYVNSEIISGRFRTKPYIAFAGTSLEAFAFQDDYVNTKTRQWTNYGWVGWFRQLGMGRFFSAQRYLVGIASSNTNSLVGVQLSAILALSPRPSIVIVGGPTNDLTNLSFDQTTTNLKYFYRTCNDLGIAVVQQTVEPQSAWSATVRKQAQALNLWMRSFESDASYLVRLVDTNEVVADPALGNKRANFVFADGIHDSSQGAFAKATATLAQVTDLLPAAARILPGTVLDAYDVTDNPRGNILAAAGSLTGTGGTTSNGASGTVAAGMTLNGNSGTATMAGSKGTSARNPAINTQIITLSGTAGTIGPALEQSANPGNPGGLAAGDQVFAEGYLSWSGASNVKTVEFRFFTADAVLGTQTVADGAGGQPGANAAIDLPAAATGLYVRTPPIVLGGAPTSMRVQVRIDPTAAGTIAGAFAIEPFAIRKVVAL